MRSLPPSSRSSSSLVALPASSILQRHCHIRQACPATLSIPLVSQTIRQNRPYAFIEAPHPPSFLHLPHCLIPLSSVSGNPAGRCSTATRHKQSTLTAMQARSYSHLQRTLKQNKTNDGVLQRQGWQGTAPLHCSYNLVHFTYFYVTSHSYAHISGSKWAQPIIITYLKSLRRQNGTRSVATDRKDICFP